MKTIQRYNNTHVYSYDYHEALDDDKIVPFRPYVIQTEATMDGIVYDGKYYSLSDFGTNVYIHDTHRKVANEIAEIKDALTLVFAQNTDHANIIAEDFREVFAEELQIDNPKECVKAITSENRACKQ
ncbi:hypothetical protein [Haloquadratum walsbyi]|uniref:Uncharacterized protein n=1 Tax=Haloquadratum walsbyi J07HQW2 TaxID=1238425 RepID=U1PJX6_9EURY|nr:hypothetical protein [Haloquadratum walsbyi]ERG93967.1 MAG: hypothetical protein J07HQW2_00401 [Haloquadratum walsbyi J07HQW2]